MRHPMDCLRRSTVCLALFLAILCVCCGPAVGADVPDIAAISAALQKQEAARIDVKYVTTATPAGAQTEPEAFIESHYIRTPGVLWLKDTGKSGSKEVVESSYDRLKQERRSLTTEQDGSQRASVSHGIAGISGMQSILDPVHFSLASGIEPRPDRLHEWVDYGTVSKEMEEVDGHRCWRIDITDPVSRVEKFVVWVDPAVGFCPRQIDGVRRNVRIRFDEYCEVARGIWFPKLRAVEVTKGAAKATTLKYRVKEVKMAEVSDDASLIVKFPSGIPVRVDGKVQSAAP